MSNIKASELMPSEKLKRDVGTITAMGIIVGQMIGSGIYMTPQGLAELANPKAAILAMLITGTGTILLAICLLKMGERNPISGSAIVYTREAFGKLPAFLVGWSYWCGCWMGNGAIILGGLNYVSYFFPGLAENGMARFLITIFTIWIFTFINIKGIKGAAIVNLVLTILKLLPLLVFIIIASLSFDIQNFNTVSSPKVAGFSVLPVAVAYVLWPFTGFEGATVVGGEVKNSKSIRLSTIIGTCVVIILYLVVVILAAGAMPQDQLATSQSPFSDIIFNATGGYWAGGFIALGVSISALGAMGAWIMAAARIAFSLGEQNLFPAFFKEVDPQYKTPKNALLVNAVLMTLVMLAAYQFQEGGIYNFFVLLSVMSLLVFYAFGAASKIVIFSRGSKPLNPWAFIKESWLGLLAFAYSTYAIFGSGGDAVKYGFLLLLAGMPFYIYVELKNNSEK